MPKFITEQIDPRTGLIVQTQRQLDMHPPEGWWVTCQNINHAKNIAKEWVISLVPRGALYVAQTANRRIGKKLNLNWEQRFRSLEKAKNAVREKLRAKTGPRGYKIVYVGREIAALFNVPVHGHMLTRCNRDAALEGDLRLLLVDGEKPRR